VFSLYYIVLIIYFFVQVLFIFFKKGIPASAGMTVWIKGILEFLGEVMDGVKGDSCLESE
jgi:hypothetical protein